MLQPPPIGKNLIIVFDYYFDSRLNATPMFVHVFLAAFKSTLLKALLQIRRGNRDNLGIMFHIAPFKYML